MTDVEWMASASCLSVGPELFHPDKGGSAHDAKKVCDGCIVRTQCLEFYLAEPYGIYGGTSPKDRIKLRKQRRAA